MEQLQCLFDSPGLRISYDTANELLYTQWLGEHDKASVLMHVEDVCRCLHAQPCPKILSDHSMLRGDWRMTAPTSPQLFARLAAQGVQYFAWVYSSHFTDRVAMQKALYHTTQPAIAIFDEVLAAHLWLQRCAVNATRLASE